MSKCHHSTVSTYSPMIMPQTGYSSCICSLPTLIILILIVLQFSKCGKDFCHDDDEDGDSYGYGCGHISNGILFIIALFFLSCVGCGKGVTGGFGGFGGRCC